MNSSAQELNGEKEQFLAKVCISAFFSPTLAP